MVIMHYSLGFPPYRSGGLTKYAVDLAAEQRKQGHTVCMLWPGKISLGIKTRIIKRHDYCGIQSYELINPLPVPLIYGIMDTALYTAPRNKDTFIEIINKLNPSVIHLHTLMGLPIEFMQAAKELCVKTVFTSHDYFGICPKGNLFYNGKNCNYGNNFRDCYQCNQSALSYGAIKIMQSPLYRVLKYSPTMRVFRRKGRQQKQAIQSADIPLRPVGNADEKARKYSMLQNYYAGMFDLIDLFIFNSEQAKQVYTHIITPRNSLVLPVSHASIKDNRRIGQYREKLRLIYLGPASEYKGYFLLLQAVKEMVAEGYDKLELHLYNQSGDNAPFIIHHEPFCAEELESVFENADMLTVPSMWRETFGLVVMEALSFSVPVLVTTNVGARDLISDKNGYVVEPSKEAVKKVLIAVYKDRDILKKLNRAITEDSGLILDFKDHVRRLVSVY